MRTPLSIVAFLLLITAFVSCQESEVDTSFLEDYEVCLKVDGKVVHEYDPLTWQLSYNSLSNTFRVHNDNMSEYFVLKCNSAPTYTGQNLTGSLEWSTPSDIKTGSGLSLTIEQMDASGNVWLWCSKKNIGVCVRVLD